MAERVRVLLVDDHEVVRIGVRIVLERTDDLELVGETGSAAESLRLHERLRPDVTVMDVRLVDGSGIVATQAIRREAPDARVLFYTASDDDEVLFHAIVAGAAGYLVKGGDVGQLVEGIRQVAAGHSPLDASVTAGVLERLRQARTTPTDERLARLSPRELEVLDRVADGRSNQEIADAMFLSEKTVKNHLTRIMTKLGVSRRTEAAAYHHRHATPHPH